MEASLKELFDTSVIVASLLSAHPDHVRCRESVRAAGLARGAMSAHSLAECYATLTRMPPGVRISPAVARSALRGLPFDIVPLSEDDYWDVLRRSTELGLAGGVLYDLLHVKAAEVCRAKRIVALNARHFLRLVQGTSIEVVEP